MSWTQCTVLAWLLLTLFPALAEFLPEHWALGDDPHWALPTSDDSHWRHDLSTLPSAPFFEPSIYWRRQWVTLEDPRRYHEPALWLGRLGQADEVFLNGVLLGGTGVIGIDLVEALWVERLYRIPPGLLRTNNLLAIRIQIPHGQLATLKTPQLGEWPVLALVRYQNEAPRRNTEIIVTSSALVAILFLMAFRTENSSRRLAYVAGFANLLFLIFYHSDSLILQQWLADTPPLSRIDDVALALFPALVLEWIRLMLKRPPLRFRRALAVGFVGLAFGFIVRESFAFYQALSLSWVVFVVAGLAIILGDTWQAWLIRGFTLAPLAALFIMVVGMAILYLLDVVGWWHSPPLAWNYPSVLVLPLLDAATLHVIHHDYRNLAQATQRLAGQLLTVQERERQRLSRELHDGLAQDLSSIKLNLGLGMARLDQNDPDGAKNILGITVDVATDAIDELRNLLNDLRPLYLDALSLSDALRSVIQRFERITDILVDQQLDEGIELPLESKAHLIRMAQESLTNIAKHAEASQVVLRLERHPSGWSFIIRDNGRGFDSTQPCTGLGLLTLRERAALLGGHLFVNSRSGAGVEIIFEMLSS